MLEVLLIVIGYLGAWDFPYYINWNAPAYQSLVRRTGTTRIARNVPDFEADFYISLQYFILKYSAWRLPANHAERID